MGNSFKSANFLMDSRLTDAAHKWFNLAALNGSAEATMCRADISDEMTAREIVEAQRQARAWLQATDQRRAA